MVSTASIQARAHSFEVMIRCDGRWTLDCLLEAESEAMRRGKELFARGAGDEVKVLRRRSRAGGQSITSEIFHKSRQPSKTPRFAVAGSPETAPYCRSLADLDGLAGRKAIGVLLRQYLVHHGITSSELLFGWRHARRFLDQASLLQAALQTVGRAQAEAAEEPPATRIRALEALVSEAAQRARLIQQQREDLPALCDQPAAAASAAIGGRPEGSEHDEIFFALLSDHLAMEPSLSHKLQALLALVPGAAGSAAEGPIEAVIADCLDFSEVVEELFPDEPTLFSFLCRLSDVVAGRLPAGTERDRPQLAVISLLIRAGRADSCQSVLEDRLVDSLAGNKPLDRHKPATEGRLVELLGRRLRRADGAWIGGERAQKALDARRRRLRQDTLRRIGLESAADAAGAKGRG